MRRRLAALLAALPLAGCIQLGPRQLQQDTVSYAQALGNAQNQQTLLNVVRLRYADSPSFLQTTQIISSYQLQQTLNAGLEAYPSAATSAGNYISGGLGGTFQQSPTFTLEPITGKNFAESFLRPFSPAELMPFVGGGIPVDILFRLDVQSINGLQNSRELGGSDGLGAPDFFLLLHDLRLLQIGGVLDGGQVETKPADGKIPAQTKTILAIEPTDDPDLARVAAQTRALLGMKPNEQTATVYYGTGKPPSGQIMLQTRPMLGILNQLAMQVEVPPGDIKAGLTNPTVGNVGIAKQPVVVVHSGDKAPKGAFVSVKYGDTWFWIANDDFNSKVAFSIVQTLLSLAQTSATPGTILTIPTG